MLKKRAFCLVVMCVVALMTLPQISSAGGFNLLTMEEARELDLDDAEWNEGVSPKSIGFGIGPKIVFEAPKVTATDKGPTIDSPSTMDLLVVFQDGVSPVDMKTLEIKARKGWFSKNLTKRMEPYLTGKMIKAEDVKIPSGRFKLEITVSDTEGRESSQTYLCEIRE